MSPAAPVIVNAAANGTLTPNANAGSDQNVAISQQVTVNGSASSDPNTHALALTQQWSFAQVPGASALQNANILSPTSTSARFTPDAAGDYVLNLVVSNSNGPSAAATTTVHAFTGNITPNASAGPPQFTTPSSTVTLSSTASNDPDNAPQNISFLWWLNSLPTVSATSLLHPLTAAPQFVADTPGYFIARVESTDGLASGFSNTLITAAQLCDADANGVINQTDIALIQAALGLSVLSGDPRDFNVDGRITQADVTGCSNILAPAPTLQVSPGSFTENLLQGGVTVQQPIQISSTGNPLTFTVMSSQPWLTASRNTGSTASVSSNNAQVSPGVLGVGQYTGTLTFTPNTGTAQVVNVTLNVAAPPPPPPPPSTFMASPASLQLSASGCTAGVTSAPFTLTSSNPAFSWSATGNTSWLSVMPSQGTNINSATLTIHADPTGLPEGVYNGAVIVTGANATTLTYPVTLTVGPSLLMVSPLGLSFGAVPGAAAAAQSLTVASPCGNLPYTAQADQPWLTVTPASGIAPAQLTVTASAATLASGNFTGHVTIASPGSVGGGIVIPVFFGVESAAYALVNSATLAAGPVAPGSIFTIFGPRFTNAAMIAQTLPLPTSMGGVTVTAAGTPVPLLYVGLVPDQRPIALRTPPRQSRSRSSPTDSRSPRWSRRSRTSRQACS